MKEVTIEDYLGMTLEEAFRDILLLQCLQEAGVDNWDGYERAIELFQEKV